MPFRLLPITVPFLSAGSMPEPGREPVTVSLRLGDGSSQQFYGALADFGPMFEAGCSDGSRAGSSNGGSRSGSDGGNSGGSEEEDGATHSGKASSKGPPQPPKQLQWQGLPLLARQGGPPGRLWRAVYVLAGQRPGSTGGEQQEADEDDPYEDVEGAPFQPGGRHSAWGPAAHACRSGNVHLARSQLACALR